MGRGPGRRDEAAEQAEVDEVACGVGGLPGAGDRLRCVREEQSEQARLEAEQLAVTGEIRSRMRWIVESGLADTPARGVVVRGRDGVAAVDRMQLDVGRLRQQLDLPGGAMVSGLIATWTGVAEQASVQRAGEHDGQPPSEFPGPAMLVLDRAAVSGQAVRAVAAGSGEHPVLLDEDPVVLALAAGERGIHRRVAVGEADQGQRGDFRGGQVCRSGEGCGVIRREGKQKAGGNAGLVGVSEAGEDGDPGR